MSRRSMTRRALLASSAGIALTAGCSSSSREAQNNEVKETETAEPTPTPEPTVRSEQYYSTPLNGEKVYQNHLNAQSQTSFEALFFYPPFTSPYTRVYASPGGPLYRKTVFRGEVDATYYTGKKIFTVSKESDGKSFGTVGPCGYLSRFREPFMPVEYDFAGVLSSLQFAYDGVQTAGEDLDVKSNSGGIRGTQLQVYSAITPESITDGFYKAANAEGIRGEITEFEFVIGIDKNKLVRYAYEFIETDNESPPFSKQEYIINQLGVSVPKPDWVNNAKQIVDSPTTC